MESYFKQLIQCQRYSEILLCIRLSLIRAGLFMIHCCSAFQLSFSVHSRLFANCRIQMLAYIRLMSQINSDSTLADVCLPFKHEFLFINQCAEFLLLRSSTVLFTFNFVPCSDRFQLGIFDFLSLTVKHLDQCCHHIIERHNLLEEIYGFRLHVLRFTVLVSGKHTNLVIVIESDVHIYFAVHCNLEL